MTTSLNDWTFRRVVWATLVLVSVALGFWLLYRFNQVLSILLIAVSIGTVIGPGAGELQSGSLKGMAGGSGWKAWWGRGRSLSSPFRSNRRRHGHESTGENFGGRRSNGCPERRPVGPACAACPVRQAVLDTFADGQSRQDVEAWLHFFQRDSAEERTEAALHGRAAQLALLNEIGDQVAALLHLDQVLDRAARLVQERFSFHHVDLFTRAAGCGFCPRVFRPGGRQLHPSARIATVGRVCAPRSEHRTDPAPVRPGDVPQRADLFHPRTPGHAHPAPAAPPSSPGSPRPVQLRDAAPEPHPGKAARNCGRPPTNLALTCTEREQER
jgi:hypothetical protein